MSPRSPNKLAHTRNQDELRHDAAAAGFADVTDRPRPSCSSHMLPFGSLKLSAELAMAASASGNKRLGIEETNVCLCVFSSKKKQQQKKPCPGDREINLYHSMPKKYICIATFYWSDVMETL